LWKNEMELSPKYIPLIYILGDTSLTIYFNEVGEESDNTTFCFRYFNSEDQN